PQLTPPPATTTDHNPQPPNTIHRHHHPRPPQIDSCCHHLLVISLTLTLTPGTTTLGSQRALLCSLVTAPRPILLRWQHPRHSIVPAKSSVAVYKLSTV
ncbi:hypothetical protein PIB30_106560, partial [Stylosanthes scabra]|nr:hypothetical protein [Stylosanthes scabra]